MSFSPARVLNESDITNLTVDLAGRAQTKNGGLETVVTVPTSGSSYSVNITNANVFAITLSANCVISFTGAPAGKSCTVTLLLKQDTTGGRTVTWPVSLKWSDAVTPSLTTASGQTDFVSLLTVDGGSTWYGFVSGLNY